MSMVTCPLCKEAAPVHRVRRPIDAPALVEVVGTHYAKDEHGKVVRCVTSGRVLEAVHRALAKVAP